MRAGELLTISGQQRGAGALAGGGGGLSSVLCSLFSVVCLLPSDPLESPAFQLPSGGQRREDVLFPRLVCYQNSINCFFFCFLTCPL